MVKTPKNVGVLRTVTTCADANGLHVLTALIFFLHPSMYLFLKEHRLTYQKKSKNIALSCYMYIEKVSTIDKWPMVRKLPFKQEAAGTQIVGRHPLSFYIRATLTALESANSYTFFVETNVLFHKRLYNGYSKENQLGGHEDIDDKLSSRTQIITENITFRVKSKKFRWWALTCGSKNAWRETYDKYIIIFSANKHEVFGYWNHSLELRQWCGLIWGIWCRRSFFTLRNSHNFLRKWSFQ